MSSYHESAELKSGRSTTSAALLRALVEIEGRVQGVGFRPFIYRLAKKLRVQGCVANTSSGVKLEIEGAGEAVQAFLTQVQLCHPPLSQVTRLRYQFVEPSGHRSFVIRDSQQDGPQTALISPDVAVCDDCLGEMFDERDRRYLYPLINCTNCGPRYSIIRDVPYDRLSTTMACFAMCPACQAEYEDPDDRRFHAQANGCANCGPRVWLVETSEGGQPFARGAHRSPQISADPIQSAFELLRGGAIIAVKGLGGFHLACDAANPAAVQTLRQRKHRQAKPFALMVPDLAAARDFCRFDGAAERLITSPERPIAVLQRRAGAPVADAVAPDSRHLGLMLPYTPLHYRLLFDESRQPRFRGLVMTSGNQADEPIATGNREAIERLSDLADAFLLHDRDILIAADDSVVRVEPVAAAHHRQPQHSAHRSVPTDGPLRQTVGGSTLIRRARGYVPAPILLPRDLGEVLAVGGQFKSTVALSRGNAVFLSQHLGDLLSVESLDSLQRAVQHLQRILGVRPTIVAHDLHPDYISTRFAARFPAAQLVAVQHHHAHVAACMAEHGLSGPVIGLALDGTGYGTDGHVWGGEILIVDYHHFQRAAHLRELPLPGNEQAIRQPWRMALSYLDAAYGDRLWELGIPFLSTLERPAAELLLRASRRGVGSPLTSSCGRLFDAVAALVGFRRAVQYEGQAAIQLEMAAQANENCRLTTPADYYIAQVDKRIVSPSTGPRFACPHAVQEPFVLDPAPLIRAVVNDIGARIPVAVISRRFHQALVQSLAAAVQRVANCAGMRNVVLSGGCFQNHFLQSMLILRLESMGFQVFAPRLVPPNDGGLALGQIVVAAALRAVSHQESGFESRNRA